MAQPPPQQYNLPPQYYIPPAIAAAAAAAAAAAGRTPSPGEGRLPASASHAAPSRDASAPAPPPSSVSTPPIPGAFRHGTQRRVQTIQRPDEFPPVPPPPLPPKTPEKNAAPTRAGLAPPPAPPKFLPVHPSQSQHGEEGSRPSSSASSRAAVEDTLPPPRLQLTPRKRKALKGVKVRSPRATVPPRKRERERERAGTARPSIFTTLGYLLVPLRVVAWPFHAAASPILAHAANTALLLALLAVGLYIFVARLRDLVGILPAAVVDGALFPVRTLATPTCLLANVMCPLSLLSDANSTAQPFWRLWSPGTTVDVARVSRSLSTEVRVARDIFDSLSSLGDGRMMEGLAHVRIHELGIAIQTGSTLDDRMFIGQELVELADTASSVADEIVKINAMSVSIFSWLFWEFSHIVKLLDLPEGSRPTTRTLTSRLDSLVSRLDADLDRLYVRVGAAIPVAERGAQQGWTLHEHLSFVVSDLRAEHEKYPTWQRALEAGVKFFAGGDPSKLTRIRRDLEVTRATILGITETRNSLEHVRIGLVAFRDQVRHFSASVMGLHLGADEAIGLGPAEELAILSTVVGELGSSVGRAKRIGGDAREMRIEA